jgi:hypothetical protein
MSIAKRLGVFAGAAAAAAALSVAGCANEEARSPDPAPGEGAPAAAVTDSRPAPERPAVMDSQPAAAGEKEAAPGGGAEEAAEKPSDKTAKPSAPVQVAGRIRPGAADLEVVFGSDATDVSVKVWGTDGLKVKSAPEPVSGASVSKGQTLKVSVLFDAPAATANLAVGVNGTFGGKSQGKVQSFTVNPAATVTTPTSTTKDTSSGATEPAKDSGGRKVKVMKAP